MNTAPDEASAALAQIRDRQEQVIRAALIPIWYWWAICFGPAPVIPHTPSRIPISLAAGGPLGLAAR